MGTSFIFKLASVFFQKKMGRKYTRKTSRGCDSSSIQAAIDLIRNQQYSVKSAATLCNVNRTTLSRHMKKGVTAEFTPYRGTSVAHKVFTDDQEKELAEHITDLAKAFHGLSVEKLKQLACQYACHNSIKTPPSWENNSQAGK